MKARLDFLAREKIKYGILIRLDSNLRLILAYTIRFNRFFSFLEPFRAHCNTVFYNINIIRII